MSSSSPRSRMSAYHSALASVEGSPPLITPTMRGTVDSDAEEEAHLQRLLERARKAARAEVDPLMLQQERILLDSEDEEEKPDLKDADASLFLETPLTATASDAKTKRPEHLRTKEDQMPPRKLSKKQKKAARPHTAGPQWFDMPAPEPTPELKREIQAMRLTGALDPKYFQRGEARRERGKMPEFFQVGHVLDSRHPASTNASQPVARKRTFLETLVDDTEAKAYAKKKYNEVQGRAASGGKNHYKDKMARRRR